MVYNGLRGSRSPLQQKKDDFDVYLQGSYANTTHIYGGSDVDIVVRLESSWRRDLSELDRNEKERYHEDYDDADYGYRDFYGDVKSALKTKFGSKAVKIDDKAVKLDSDHCSLPLNVDVVPAQEYRVYYSYPPGDSEPDLTRGIFFRDQFKGTDIYNFPKEHRWNGENKNSRCNGNYKETIRMFKHARNHIGDKLLFGNGDVPSYFIECLLYNIPYQRFRKSDLGDRFVAVLEFLEQDKIDVTDMQQQNEMVNLTGSTVTTWTAVEANSFIEDLRELWNGWPH
ncbi:nucleotidyltransferase [Natronococcus sp. A-GB7]|uniref:nucleotidyltransferase domain-containing protein n=1 Tax=Natronococcus sp. A-GB7 TaxID=3037649 RepID=UPI0024203AF2|nr:nucleotidyltransferase [Natronococcus sp. A-GB7]MDG5818119.1 nucleotidyltransferase [Natronococcus sp. A-GB7]